MERQFRILCVDDNGDSNEVLKLTLEMDGHEVTVAESAKTAQKLITTREYDLYILDIEMPETNGWELCRAIRAGNRQVPIIFYTAAAYEKDKALGIESGATLYLVKPDGINIIAQEVNSLIKKHCLIVSQNNQARPAAHD